MSNINAYIINSNHNPIRLVRDHKCIWDFNLRESKEKFILKVEKLKKFCALNLFLDKFIVNVSQNVVCVLCEIYLMGTKEQAYYHLISSDHFKNFCNLVNTNLGFTLEDLLNGFNLEAVIRWIYSYEVKIPEAPKDCFEERICLIKSNDGLSVYANAESSFSPKFIEDLLNVNDSDFVVGNRCILCNVDSSKSDHLTSKLHCMRVSSLNGTTGLLPQHLWEIYIKNREKRLRPYLIQIRMYTQFFDILKLFNFEIDLSPYSQAKNLKSTKAVIEKPSKLYFQRDEAKVHQEYKVKLSENNNKHVDDNKHMNDKQVKLLIGVPSKSKNESDSSLPEQKSEPSVLKGQRNPHEFNKSKITVRGKTKSLVAIKSLEETARSSQKEKISSAEKKEDPQNLHLLPTEGKNISENSNSNLLKNKGDKLVTIVVNDKSTSIEKETLKAVKSENIGKKKSEPKNTEQNLKTQKQDLVEEKKKRKMQMDLPEIWKIYELMINTADSGNSTDAKQDLPTPLEKKIVSAEMGEKAKENPTNKNSEKSHENKVQQETKKKIKHKNNRNEDNILIVKGLKKNSAKYLSYVKFFWKFGEVKYLIFNSENVSVLSFFSPRAVKSVLSGPLYFDGVKLEISCSAEAPRIKLNKKIVSLLLDPQQLMDFILNLLNQSVNIYNSLKEKQREEQVCSTITSALSKIFPFGRCYPFGSRVSGLTLSNSDLDVFFDRGGKYFGDKSFGEISEKTTVSRVATALGKSSECTKIIAITRARVPIVSFLHVPTKMYCDLSVKNGLSVQNTLLLRFILSLDWRVKPLILFLKHWAAVSDLHGPPFFSSYGIALLVIFYLEQLSSPVLPTIETLQNLFRGRRMTIDGWDCNFTTDVSLLPKTSNNDPLIKLLLGFFEFYSEFDYSTYIIAPLTGKPLLRKIFKDSENIELPMPYKRQIHNLMFNNLTENDAPLCIMDPFDMNHILTKGFPKQAFKQFLELCAESAFHLKKGFSTISEQMLFTEASQM